MLDRRFLIALGTAAAAVAAFVVGLRAVPPAEAAGRKAECRWTSVNDAPEAISAWMDTQLAAGKTEFVAPGGTMMICAW